jgi:hypothetical protein
LRSRGSRFLDSNAFDRTQTAIKAYACRQPFKRPARARWSIESGRLSEELDLLSRRAFVTPRAAGRRRFDSVLFDRVAPNGCSLFGDLANVLGPWWMTLRFVALRSALDGNDRGRRC